MPSDPLDRFTVYGRRRTGRLGSDGRALTAGVHADRLLTYDMAASFLVNVCMQHGGEHNIDAVIVRLVKNVDNAATNQVVHRVGQGKAWWE